jgi:predicted acyltransferase (DUF342 family)
MNIKEIQQLIKFVAKSGVSEVKIESKDLKLSVKTGVSGNVVSHTEPVLGKCSAFSSKYTIRNSLRTRKNSGIRRQ